MSARPWPVAAGVLLGFAGLLAFGLPGTGLAAIDLPAIEPREAEGHSWIEAPREEVLAARRDAFVETEDGRLLARVDARLVRRGERKALTVLVDATGPTIDPVPGLEGVPGCNLMTAREIDALLAEADGLRAYVRLASGRRVEAGVVPGYPVRLPARRLGEDGRIDHHARTAPVVTGFTVVAADLPAGAHRLEVEARGEVRLAGEFEVREDGATLEALRATGGLHRTRTHP